MPGAAAFTGKNLLAKLDLQWQAARQTCANEATAIAAVATSVKDLCAELASASFDPRIKHARKEGMLDPAAEWQLLFEIGRIAARVPNSTIFGDVVGLVHRISIGNLLTISTCGKAAPNEDSLVVGSAVETLCEYLDVILVPMALRRPNLRHEAFHCLCERCLRSLQVTHTIQEDLALEMLIEVATIPFLSFVLEYAVQASDQIQWSCVLQAAETLAVLGTYVRLQDRSNFHVPQGLLHAMVALLRKPVAAPPGLQLVQRVMLETLHILRNIAVNHAQVMQMTSEIFGECSRQLWSSLEDETSPTVRGREVTSEPRQRRRRAVNDEGSSERAHGLLQQADPKMTSSASSSATLRHDGGNPQESDECTSGAEVGQDPGMAKGIGKVVDATAQLESPRHANARHSQNYNTAAVPDTGQHPRHAELLVLASIVLQALFQTDEGLQQHAFISEEALRWQIVAAIRRLRESDVMQPCHERLTFQGLRLYLLVCRSSHARRQYAVLQKTFVEEERRTVAFLLSLTPPAQCCCVLLRAMTQDVNSWLLWQSQAAAKPNATIGRSCQAQGLSPRKQTRQRRCHQTARSSEAQASPVLGGAPKDDHMSQSKRAVDKSSPIQDKEQKGAQSAAEGHETEQLFEEEAANLARLFTSGEAVWLIHAVVLVAIVACLVAVWHSLERPRGPFITYPRFNS